MKTIESVEELEALYGAPSPGSLTKVQTHITPLYRRWIEASRFLILSTVGPDGTDASPRGDAEPIVTIADDRTLLLPDWQGNNRLDSLRNIVQDERISLLFMVPGGDNVVRVNGTAGLTAEGEYTGRFEHDGTRPKTVVVVRVAEIYFQCAKALMRSRLWLAGDESIGLPTAGEFLKELDETFDAQAYDDAYPERAKERMW